MIERILVLDVGTSALKAVLFGRDGATLASAEVGYGPATAPHRQDPEGWWAAARVAVESIGVPAVDAIALTGTMENLIAVDGQGRALGNAILYSDPCGGEALNAYQEELDSLGAAPILGNAPEPLMTAFKLCWLRGNHPEIFGKAACFLPGAKDYLAFRLTGRAVTDPTTATTTGLMGLAERAWSDALVEALELPEAKLPDILPATAVLGPVLPEAAAELGLEAGHDVRVVNGCGDAGATTLGSYCRSPGDISLYLGTTGWLARVGEAEKSTGTGSVYRLAHPSPGLVIEITPILSAGAAAAWARRTLSLSDGDAEARLAAADETPPDLLFLPYLVGERSPFMDSEVRGAFLGLDSGHDAGALYYAVLEGVALAIRANLQAIDPAGEGRIRLVGGGAKSALWPQLLADILMRPIAVPRSAPIATAAGAFLIAAEAFGLAAKQAEDVRVIEPRAERRVRAERLGAGFAAATGFARTVVLRGG